jgi:ribonuclease Z
MRPTFHPRLLNGPWGDPALLVRLLGLGRTLLFDLGDLSEAPVRVVLRAGHAFISHAHMDHFCGLDTVIRYHLGRAKTFRIVGPPGIADRVEAKLSAYTWNLVAEYADEFTVEVTEWLPDALRRRSFACREGFVRRELGTVAEAGDAEGLKTVWEEAAFKVSAAQLDHGIPSLGYRLEEPCHVNVSPEGLRRLGLTTGPWVRGLKEAAHRLDQGGLAVELPNGGTRPLADFLDAGAILLTEGQKVAYLADCGWRGATPQRAVALARRVHILYCEAGFLSSEDERAAHRCHLTAAQAGEIARRAGAAELRLFHFSPKYKGRGFNREAEFIAEARTVFDGTVRIG